MTRKAKTGKRKRQKTGLNRSILDTGWGMLRSMIEYKLAECNGVFVEVPTVKVKLSQTCPACGRQQKKELSERIHTCPCAFTCTAILRLQWLCSIGQGVWNVPLQTSMGLALLTAEA